MADKNETKPAAPVMRLKMVKTTEPVQFFNVAGAQISEGMSGIHLRWDGEKVIVTSEAFPGQEKWILPATIAFMGWADA